MSRDTGNHKLCSDKWNISFAGCGFLGLYHAGVCGCIQEYAPQLIEGKKISGASAGSIAAACLICNIDLGECVQYLMQVVNKAQSYRLGPFDPRFKVTDHLREGLCRLLPKDAHLLCSNRLHISMTNQSNFKNVVVNQFKSRDELIRAILCSSYIPLFSGFVPLSFRGEWMIDGGVTNNILELDRHTITVSPFCGDADICPKDDWGYGHVYIANTSVLLNYENLKRVVSIVWPQSPAKLSQLCQQGYNDTLKFLARQGMITCNSHFQRLVFMTVKVKSNSSGHPLDQCEHCKRVLHDALNSSVPTHILKSFEDPSSASWISRLVRKRLRKGLKMLFKPATIPMEIFLSILLSTTSYLTHLPIAMRPIFSCLESTIQQLTSIFKQVSLAPTVLEQSRMLCGFLSNFKKPSPAPLPPIELPSFSIDMDHAGAAQNRSYAPSSRGTRSVYSVSISDREDEDADSDSDSFDGIPEIELKRILQSRSSSPALELLQQLDSVEGLADVVKIESIHEVNAIGPHLNLFSQRSSRVNTRPTTPLYEEKREEPEGDSCQEEDIDEMLDEALDLSPCPNLVDLLLERNHRLSWTYRDYEGAEDLKMFMVVPVATGSDGRMCRSPHPSAFDGDASDDLFHIDATPEDDSGHIKDLDDLVDDANSPSSDVETDFSVDN